MDKLANYGTDEEYEESPKLDRTEYQDRRGTNPKSNDVNYDEVGMDLSEDSNGSSHQEQPPKSDRRDSRERKHRDSPKHRNREYPDRRDREDREDRDRRDRNEDRRDRYEDRKDKNEDRKDDYKRDSRDRDDYRRDSRDKDDYDRRHRKGSYRDDRRSKRSNSRERHRSRSPRRNRRSGSRERSGGKFGGYSRRYDKATNKMAHLEKMGIEIKSPDEQYMDKRNDQGEKIVDNKFFMPGVTGRLREQMERRKQLWQKKEQPEKVAPIVPVQSAGPSKSGKVWGDTIFAQDQDGKQASKFKRLMGIKDSSADINKPATDIVKKQEELFHSMEQQYEVARTATHTMRGVGLGFGSFQR